jgi:hypothetical protein
VTKVLVVAGAEFSPDGRTEAQLRKCSVIVVSGNPGTRMLT